MSVQFSICLLFQRSGNCQGRAIISGSSSAFSLRDFSSPVKPANWKAIFSPLAGHVARQEDPFHVTDRPVRKRNASTASGFASASLHQTGKRFPAFATNFTLSRQTAQSPKRCNTNQEWMAEYNIQGFDREARKSSRLTIDKSRIRDSSKLSILLSSDPCMRRRREWTRQPAWFNGEVQ